jgi:hypothetical protein
VARSATRWPGFVAFGSSTSSSAPNSDASSSSTCRPSSIRAPNRRTSSPVTPRLRSFARSFALEPPQAPSVIPSSSANARHGARRSRIPAFVQLQRRIRAHRAAIDVALTTGLSQGLVESTNTKIRLLTRIAFGFQGYQPLIALAMLALGSHPPRLPGRN